jgi:general secretion pathway protein J
MSLRRVRGFTLIELVVAIAIFAVLGTMTYTAMAGMMRQQEVTGDTMDRFRELQQAITLISRDLEQATPRPIRGASHGQPLPAFGAGGFTEMPLEFTRGGIRNPMGQQRASMQRIAYAIEDGRLLRYSWQVLDRAQDSEPLSSTLLDQVALMETRFMDGAGDWHEQWPPVRGEIVGEALSLMPRGVELRIELEDWGTIRRVVELPAP